MAKKKPNVLYRVRKWRVQAISVNSIVSRPMVEI